MKYILFLTALFLSLPAAALECAPAGCSGEICAEKGSTIASPCLYSPMYDCFKQLGVCEAQIGTDGRPACNWRQTPQLQACVNERSKPGAVAPNVPAPAAPVPPATGQAPATPGVGVTVVTPTPDKMQGCTVVCNHICVSREQAMRAKFRCEPHTDDVCFQGYGRCAGDAAGQCVWQPDPNLFACVKQKSGAAALQDLQLSIQGGRK